MKKLNKVAVLFASAALAAPLIALAQTPTAEQFKYATGADQWRAADGTVGRTAPTSSAGAIPAGRRRRPTRTCDGALQPPPAAAAGSRAVASHRRPPAAPAAPAPPPAACRPSRRPGEREGHLRGRRVLRLRQVRAQARSAGQADDLVEQDQGREPRSDHRRRPHRLDRVRTRTTRSCRCAVPKRSRPSWSSKGVEKNRIYTEGKGEKQPVADNKTGEGRAKNRRVEIEVVGTRAKQVNRERLRGRFRRKPRFGGVFYSCAMPWLPSTPCKTSTRRNWPNSASSPTAGGTRRASSARCTRSTRCGWSGSTSSPACAARPCSTSAAAAASWPRRWPAAAPA